MPSDSSAQQGLAHRGAGDAEPLGHLALGQQRAAGAGAVEDGALEVVVGAGGRRGRQGRRRRGVHVASILDATAHLSVSSPAMWAPPLQTCRFCPHRSGKPAGSARMHLANLPFLPCPTLRTCRFCPHPVCMGHQQRPAPEEGPGAAVSRTERGGSGGPISAAMADAKASTSCSVVSNDAHPAHLAGRLVPEVERVALLQPLGDRRRAGREDRVGLHRPLRPPRRGVARRPASSRRAIALAWRALRSHRSPASSASNWAETKRIFDASCIADLRRYSTPAHAARVEHDDRLAEQQAVLRAAEGEHVDADVGGERPQRHVRASRPRWRSGRRRGGPACPARGRARRSPRISSGGVAGAELGALGDRDDLRLGAVLVVAAPAPAGRSARG